MIKPLRGPNALIVVDMQNDFVDPGGTLYVKGGETIVSKINQLIEDFLYKGWLVYYTKDWHPEDHSSFIEHGGIWPTHCVQGSWGSEFYEDLYVPDDPNIILKAKEAGYDEYSGFAPGDDGYAPGELEEKLRDVNVQSLFVCGLATDYCLFHTVMDALSMEFAVSVIKDSIMGVDFNKIEYKLHDFEVTDSEIAIGKMVLAGAKMI